MESAAPALTRGLALLQSLVGDGASSLEQIAKRNGWPKSSVLRLLGALEAAGCVRRDPQSKRYSALRQLTPLAATADVGALLETLAQRTACTAELWCWQDDRLALLDRREPETAEVLVVAKIGFTRDLAEAEAVTQVAFAHFVPRGQWPRRIHAASPAGGDEPIDRPRLDALLAELRARGVAIDCAPNANGVRRYAIRRAASNDIIALAQICGPQDQGPDQTMVGALQALTHSDP